MYGQANHEYLIFLATEAQRLCVCMRVGVCVCVRAHTCVCVCVGKGEFLKATGGRGEEMQRKTVVCVGEVLTCFFGSCVFLKKKKKIMASCQITARQTCLSHTCQNHHLCHIGIIFIFEIP